jgi:hypothetical protein
MRLLLLGLLLLLPANVTAAERPCDDATSVGATCSCDVRTLRPLQGAIGIEEARDKAKRIATEPKKEWQSLAGDPIKVIRGPGNSLYITDHHHGAYAWQLAGHPIALCKIENIPQFSTEAEFWSGLVQDRLARLADENGKPITPAQLPSRLELLPDDPYRTLAWLLRKRHGFCRSEMPQKEFAEFIWADWLRGRPELSAASVRSSAASVLPTALALARSASAQAMPGYVGTTAKGFKCGKEGASLPTDVPD